MSCRRTLGERVGKNRRLTTPSQYRFGTDRDHPLSHRKLRHARFAPHEEHAVAFAATMIARLMIIRRGCTIVGRALWRLVGVVAKKLAR